MTLLKSWVASANTPFTDFPLQNLPCGVFSDDLPPRCGVAIGDMILDVAALEAEGILTLSDVPLFDVPFWNELMEAGPAVWADFRTRLTAMLAQGSTKQMLLEDHLVPMATATLHMPFLVSEYTDFFASRHHATNVGTILRGVDHALPPNWLHMPIGYNGRASSVVVSGTQVRRPWGQVKPKAAVLPVFQPSARFDFELELGAVVGVGSEGPVTVAQADAMIFGFVLLNDWSARDIQAWEAQPLGPFQAKATATTISPWIVMAAALQPFRANGPARDVPLLPHLQEPGPMLYDIALQVVLNDTVVTNTNAAELYYSAAQQLTHHASSGCPMNVGDLLGSGTISGPAKGSRGSLIEISWGGTEPVNMGAEMRTFLQDGDSVTLSGHAQGDGYRIGFGACTGQIVPALAQWGA